MKIIVKNDNLLLSIRNTLGLKAVVTCIFMAVSTDSTPHSWQHLIAVIAETRPQLRSQSGNLL